MLTQKFRAPRGRLPNAVLAAGADTWTNREKICLVEAIQAVGTDDWNEVSKFVHELTKGTRTKEWCSPLHCSRQFQGIMETTGRQIRKKGDVELLPAIRQHYVDERLKELHVLAEDHRVKYMNLAKFNKDVEAGRYDDRMGEILALYGGQPTEDTQEENSGIFYFAELSDLSDKVSVINEFIQNEIGATAAPTAFPSTSQGLGVTLDAPTVPTAPTISAEEDEDLADLMDILPNMETFDADDIDATIMDTTEFEMMSPPDSTSANRKGISTSPKVSPQLKNLVRTAIAGTSEEERPRNITPSAGAPTLSMLLEMPPRDPGQPLPEISTVSKAASSLVDHTKPDRITSFRSAAATLEQLNIALAKSPTRHQDSPSKSKSSSPTLQRLLEGTMSIKKEDEYKITPTAPSVTPINLFPEEETKIKDETESVVVSSSAPSASEILATLNKSVLPANIPLTNPPAVVANPVEIISEVVQVPDEDVKIEVDIKESVVPSPAEKPRSVLREALGHKPEEIPVGEDVIVEIKEEVEESQPEVLDASEEAADIQPLPPDVQDKVNNLKDLVVIQNTGVLTPKASPAKNEPVKVAETEISKAEDSNNPLPSPPPAKATAEDSKTKFATSSTSSTSEDKFTNSEDDVSMDVSENGSISMPILTPVAGIGKSRDMEPMDEDEPFRTPPLAHKEESKESEELPDIEFDDEIIARNKLLIPSKTYSRKERFGDRGDIEDDEDANLTFPESILKSSSPSRGSPSRAMKSPSKSSTLPGPDIKGRKSRISESLVLAKSEAESAEEETRITRARAKPMSPVKASSKISSRQVPTETESSAEPPVRATRSRASATVGHFASDIPTTPITPIKKSFPSEDREQGPAHPESDHHHVTGRQTRGRVSTSAKISESYLPGVLPFESNPSSPCSSTATSNMDTQEDKDQKAFKKSISFLWEQIKSHKHAGQFLKPITESMVPHYSKKVYRPMDLTTIKRNIDNGVIRNVQIFERDVYLMLMNAIMYNSSDHEIHQRTVEMEQDVRDMLDSYKATQKALKAAQLMETMGSDNNSSILRSPVKLRSSARRHQKISDSDADELNPEEIHGFHTPMSSSDIELELEVEGSRVAGQKTRESSPDITSAVSCSSGNKRRSRTSSPTSGHLAITSAAAAGKLTERTLSTEGKSRQQSPDVNSPFHLSKLYD